SLSQTIRPQSISPQGAISIAPCPVSSNQMPTGLGGGGAAVFALVICPAAPSNVAGTNANAATRAKAMRLALDRAFGRGIGSTHRLRRSDLISNSTRQ